MSVISVRDRKNSSWKTNAKKSKVIKEHRGQAIELLHHIKNKDHIEKKLSEHCKEFCKKKKN